MTIVAAVKSRDALVLGTDSMTQVIGGTPPQLLKSYNNATKLFQLGEYPIVAATWGSGNIAHQSIGGIVLDYAETVTKSPSSIQQVAEGFAAFLGSIYDQAFAALAEDQRPVLGLLVGGYSVGKPLAELWEVRFPFVAPGKGRTQIVRAPEDFGANWRGVEIPFTRLHFGYDPRLVEKFVALGVDPAVAIQTLTQFQSPVIFDSMPIQDTIDFAKHILRTTISLTTFELGFPPCGDPLQLAVVVRRKGFEWVEEPKFHV